MKSAKRAAGIATALALGLAAPAAATTTPVGQWDLNEGWGTVAHNDWPTSGNGVISGGASWTWGRFGQALTFSGTGVVDVPDSAALDSPQVSVSAWVKSSSSPGQYKYVVGKGGNACCTGSYGLYTGINGGLEFYAATSTTTYVVSPDAGTGIWDGHWHNVIGTFDGSTVRLYVDGEQVGTGTPDATPIQYKMPSTNDLSIGNYLACAGLGFTGTIDEVKVFDRALSAGEIYNGYGLSLLLGPLVGADQIN
jgi:hypothetical protein